MSKQTQWRECPNCLTGYAVDALHCPACFVRARVSDGEVITFDDNARMLIAGYGGIYGGLIFIPGTEDLLVWCETGIFRYRPDGYVVWDSGIAGVLRAVVLDGHDLYVNGKAWNLSDGRDA